MANTAQARKRARQNTTRRQRNQSERSTMCTSIKQFEKALASGDIAASETAYKAAASMMDKTARKGLQHKNKASRMKSHLNARLKAVATAA